MCPVRCAQDLSLSFGSALLPASQVSSHLAPIVPHLTHLLLRAHVAHATPSPDDENALEIHAHQPPPSLIPLLLSCPGHKPTCSSLGYSGIPSSSSRCNTMSNCVNYSMVELDLYGGVLDDASLARMSACCPKLTHLKLGGGVVLLEGPPATITPNNLSTRGRPTMTTGNSSHEGSPNQSTSVAGHRGVCSLTHLTLYRSHKSDTTCKPLSLIAPSLQCLVLAHRAWHSEGAFWSGLGAGVPTSLREIHLQNIGRPLLDQVWYCYGTDLTSILMCWAATSARQHHWFCNAASILQRCINAASPAPPACCCAVAYST